MQYGDLASTPDCEKDSLLGLTAPMQNLFQIFEITVFLESPFIYIYIYIYVLNWRELGWSSCKIKPNG